MSIIAEFTIPTEAFALHHTLTHFPEIRLEVERLASHSSEWVMPFVWVTDGDFEAVSVAFTEDPTVGTATCVTELENAGLFKIEWDTDVESLINTIIDEHGSILEAGAHDSTWWLKLRFVDQDQLNIFQKEFEERGYSFEVQRLIRPQKPRQERFDLTATQHETLLTALEMGYFDVPREVTIDELARSLNVSPNAVSQRLRRAHRNLIRTTMVIDGHQ